MSDDVTVNIRGLEDLQRKLEEIGHNVAKRGVRQALRAGAVPVREAMAAAAPKDSGFLSEHIDIKTRMDKDELAGAAFIGPNSKAVYPRGEVARELARKLGNRFARGTKQYFAWVVARFLEFGTRKMAKKPFMTQGWETSKQSALDAIIQKLKDNLK